MTDNGNNNVTTTTITAISTQLQLQVQQFNIGAQQFKRQLQPATNKMLAHVNDEAGKKINTVNKNKKGRNALEMGQRRLHATRLVSRQIDKRMKTKKYGYVPVEKPLNSFCLMFENWNGLGIFMHNAKIKRINDLLRKYDVNCIAGCKTRVD